MSEIEQWQTNQAKAFTVRRSSQSQLTTTHIISACASETASIFKKEELFLVDERRVETSLWSFTLTVRGRQQTLQVDSKDLFLSQVEQCS